MHTTTPKPTITVGELLEKKKPTQNLYITSCAIFYPNYMLFVGNNYKECEERAEKAWLSWRYTEGYIATDGKFYDPVEAGMIAYRNRQTPRLCSPLKPEDIF